MLETVFAFGDEGFDLDGVVEGDGLELADARFVGVAHGVEQAGQSVVGLLESGGVFENEGVELKIDDAGGVGDSFAEALASEDEKDAEAAEGEQEDCEELRSEFRGRSRYCS